MNDVAITGLGIVSVLGHDLAEVSAGLREGRSGIVADPNRRARGFQSALTGALPPYDPAERLTRRELKPMGEPAIHGAVAALRAIEHAGLDRDQVASDDCGVIVSNDSACGAALAVADAVRADGTTAGLGSGHVIRVMTSSVATTLSTMLGTRGACWTVGAGCAGGTHAIGQAARLVAHGEQARLLVIGTQELSWVTVAGFDALGAFSTREDDPTAACRPFDVDRDGLVPSGGAACLVLEPRATAERRGARVWATVRGYGYSSDGHHITSPSGDGAVRAMRAALREARLAPGELDYVNAHAASTPIGDAHEARSLATLFGVDGAKRDPTPAATRSTPPISSTKSMTGHEFWMGGVSEALYVTLMMDGGFVAGTRNLATPDPTAAGLDLVREARPARLDRCLSNSFGLGGTNASIVLGRGAE